MSDYLFLKWESFDDGQIVRISLNRPEQRNAQNRGMLVELDDAFGKAEADDTVRVVILAGEGPMFSSGHDIGSKQARAEFRPGPDQHPTATINGGATTKTIRGPSSVAMAPNASTAKSVNALSITACMPNVEGWRASST